MYESLSRLILVQMLPTVLFRAGERKHMGTYNSNPCLEEVRASLMMIGLTSS